MRGLLSEYDKLIYCSSCDWLFMAYYYPRPVPQVPKCMVPSFGLENEV